MSKDERDGHDLLQEWQDQNKAWSFEGDSGLEKLERLMRALGYKENGFRWGDPIQRFLSDNPGAVEKILEFIVEQLEGDHGLDDESPRSRLIADIGPPDDDDENEEDES